MRFDELEQVEARGLKFLVRKGTSDLKTIREVVDRNAYRRKGFELEAEWWLDLGANVGAFTCLVASMGSRVVAYEPDPETFAMLEANVELNRLGTRVDLRRAAVVASQEKQVVLHLNSARGNFWRNSVVKSWRGGVDVVVPAVSLGDLPEANYCKMDVEGAEMQLLESPAVPAWERLVFEWSFDVDPSIDRFKAAIATLRNRYATVRYASFDESASEWKSSWFPPCRTVWCC